MIFIIFRELPKFFSFVFIYFDFSRDSTIFLMILTFSTEFSILVLLDFAVIFYDLAGGVQGLNN